MAKLRDKDIEEIDKIYEQYEKEARELLDKKLERLKERAERYRLGTFPEVTADARKEVNTMSPEELIGTSRENMLENYYSTDFRYVCSYDTFKRKKKDELDEMFQRMVDRERKLFVDNAPYEYVLFNSLNDGQLNEYCRLLYAYELSEALEEARKKAIFKIMEKNRKSSIVMDMEPDRREGYNAETKRIIEEDIKEVEEMGTIGTIERTRLLDEREKRRKKAIKDSLLYSEMDPASFIFDTLALSGTLVGTLALNQIPAINSINDFYKVVFALAAAGVLVMKRGYNRSMPKRLEEAKKLGVYDAIMKAKEACDQFYKYKNEMENKHGIYEQLEKEWSRVK